MQFHPWPPARHSDPDREVTELRHALNWTRGDIVELMPKRPRRVLLSYVECKDVETARNWLSVATAKIIEQAIAKNPQEMVDREIDSPRSCCPLCGMGIDNVVGKRGFTVPEGLTRHLRGTHQSWQCSVFGAAEGLAQEHFHETFP